MIWLVLWTVLIVSCNSHVDNKTLSYHKLDDEASKVVPYDEEKDQIDNVLQRQTCECSRASENKSGDNKHIDKIDHKRKEDDVDERDRIVGGYAVRNGRPWMAKIMSSYHPLEEFESLNEYQICGGSLINQQYVLTASHCVCRGPASSSFPCSEDEEDAGSLLYNPAKHHWVFLGLGDVHLDQDPKNMEASVRKDYEYGVKKIKQNPWFRYSLLIHDIALIKLDKIVSFGENWKMPICMPLKQTEEDQNMDEKPWKENRVYVAGWGRIKVYCTTDMYGPAKHSKCKRGGYGTKCMFKPSPNRKKKICKEFRKKHKDIYPKNRADGIISIIDEKRKKNQTFCYSFDKGPMGWCRTYTKGSDGQNWGWCKPDVCSNDVSYKLNEVQLSIISRADCKYLEGWNSKRNLRSGGFSEETELCAGKVKKFSSIRTYFKDEEKFTDKGHEGREQLDKLHLDDYKLDYYIGGGDSCRGDSGSPLYAWINGAPTILGIVSRGGSTTENEHRHMGIGCAEFNVPALYTRVNKYLDWIYQNSNEGNCQNSEIVEQQVARYIPFWTSL